MCVSLLPAQLYLALSTLEYLGTSTHSLRAGEAFQFSYLKPWALLPSLLILLMNVTTTYNISTYSIILPNSLENMSHKKGEGGVAMFSKFFAGTEYQVWSKSPSGFSPSHDSLPSRNQKESPSSCTALTTHGFEAKHMMWGGNNTVSLSCINHHHNF